MANSKKFKKLLFFFEKPKFNDEHVCNKEACVNIMLVQINVDKFWFEACSKL